MPSLKPLAATLILGVAVSTAQAADFSLRLIGQQSLPTGTLFQSVEFGGISGLERASDGNYWALSDERGGERGTPRFYNISLNYDAAGFKSVTINSQTNMLRPDGTPFPANARTVDPEGIRLAPNGNLYWSSEGNWSTNASDRYQPFVREMATDGTYVRSFNTPALFDYVDNRSSGARDNKLFEALALTPNGKIYTANEDALIQDGNLATLAAGCKLRVTALDPVSGNATAQYVYELPPIPVDAAPGAPYAIDNGLVELLAISDNQFIAVERAFASGVGNTIRLILTGFDAGTTNVNGIASLTGASYTPMNRELLLEMPITYQGVPLDNIEAISWGKTLDNGNRTLVLAADNNFNGTQTNLFMAFEVMPVAESKPVP